MRSEGLDISKKAKVADIFETVREISGDSLSPWLSIDTLEEIDRWVRPVYVPWDRDKTPISVIRWLRTLHFLALNPAATRYVLSRKLSIPHSSTLAIVKDLCQRGMIRIWEVGTTRTGLPKKLYKITSLGIIPLLNLYWLSGNSCPIELKKIAKNVRKDFSRIANNCKDLPFWGLFLRNWSLFEKEKISDMIVFAIVRVADYYFSQYDTLFVVSSVRERAKAGDKLVRTEFGVITTEDIDHMFDRFYGETIERVFLGPQDLRSF